MCCAIPTTENKACWRWKLDFFSFFFFYQDFFCIRKCWLLPVPQWPLKNYYWIIDYDWVIRNLHSVETENFENLPGKIGVIFYFLVHWFLIFFFFNWCPSGNGILYFICFKLKVNFSPGFNIYQKLSLKKKLLLKWPFIFLTVRRLRIFLLNLLGFKWYSYFLQLPISSSLEDADHKFFHDSWNLNLSDDYYMEFCFFFTTKIIKLTSPIFFPF